MAYLMHRITAMSTDSETVMSFKSEMEAHLAQSKLASVGVRSTVHRFSRYRALASGGYLLKVSVRDAARAKAILAKVASTEVDMDEYVSSDDESYTRCPACRSVNVQAAPLPSWLFLLFVALFGLPFLFAARDWSCRKCGHHWRG